MQNNWLNKIHLLETPPTKEAWLNITQELDKENVLQIKMLAYETNSSISILKNIFNQLDRDERTTTHCLVKKINTIYLRIAAAVIALIWMPIALRNKIITLDTAAMQAKKTKVVLPKKLSHQVEAAATLPAITSKQQTALASEWVDKITVVQPLKTITTNQLTGYEVQDLAQSLNINKKEKLQNAQGQTPMNIALMNTQNANTSITGANEQTEKVTSKFSNLLNSTPTKENLDIIIEESPKWRKKIAEWRIKMANTPVPTSFCNFADLVEMSETLEEKK